MSKKERLGRQLASLLILFLLTLVLALFAAKQLKGKTASTPQDVRNYEASRLLLLELKQSIENYRDKHENRLPDSLAELVPAYIEAVPTDAFGNSFVYEKWKDGSVALLSFLGRNGHEGGLGINKDFTLRLKVLKE